MNAYYFCLIYRYTLICIDFLLIEYSTLQRNKLRQQDDFCLKQQGKPFNRIKLIDFDFDEHENQFS